MASYTIELDAGHEEEIRQVMGQCGMASHEELVQAALGMFIWAIENIRKGHEIAAVDVANGRRQVVQSAVFDEARRRCQ